MREVDFSDGFTSAAQPAYTGPPVNDNDLATKKYIDDTVAAAAAASIAAAIAAATTVKHVIPTPTVAVDGVNNTTYLTTETAYSLDAILFFVNGIPIPRAALTLTTSGGLPAVQITDASYIPQIAQDVDLYIIQTLTPGGGAGAGVIIEPHTLLAGEITAKKFTLAGAPTDPLKVTAFIKNAGGQLPPDDFEIINSDEFSWNGKSLDGLLVAGMIIHVHYVPS